MTLAIAVTDTIDDNTQARLVAVTSPYISNSQMDTYVSGGNYDFLLNSVSFLCEHESMISIRGKMCILHLSSYIRSDDSMDICTDDSYSIRSYCDRSCYLVKEA